MRTFGVTTQGCRKGLVGKFATSYIPSASTSSGRSAHRIASIDIMAKGDVRPLVAANCGDAGVGLFEPSALLHHTLRFFETCDRVPLNDRSLVSSFVLSMSKAKESQSVLVFRRTLCRSTCSLRLECHRRQRSLMKFRKSRRSEQLSFQDPSGGSTGVFCNVWSGHTTLPEPWRVQGPLANLFRSIIMDCTGCRISEHCAARAC